jgi:ATP-binding cassette subfamily B (MDR/TAP) protein 1
MTLMFGKLTTAFVASGIAAQNAFREGATRAAFQALQDAAQDFRNTASDDALYLVFIGAFTCLYSPQTLISDRYWHVCDDLIYMVTWICTSEVAAKRLCEKYLGSILRQDVAFFDDVGAGEIATRIQTDMHLVHQGISEKAPVALSFTSTFFHRFRSGLCALMEALARHF